MKTIFIALLCAFVLFGCKSDKQKMESIICDDGIQYWDITSFEHNKLREDIDGGFAFTKKGTVISFENIGKKYRVLSEDCNDPEQKGCIRWSVSEDSIFNTYALGGIDMICLKITKCNKDTIRGKMLKADGEIIFTRVKDLNSIVKQDDPRRKELLKGRFVPIDL